MSPYFHSLDRVKVLREAAKQCIGTPFTANAMIPGIGMDCIHLNAWSYLQSGFLKEFNPPKYALDSGHHCKESQLLKWLDARPDFKFIGRSYLDTCPGDTICFKMGGLSEHHVGLMLDVKRFVHCLFFGPRQVVESSLSEDFYRKRITAVYRPMEVTP